MFGAAAMSLSSFCVVTNALRLNLLRIHDGSRDRRIRGSGSSKSDNAQNTIMANENSQKDGKEETKMEKTLRIEGMMCPHCEATVRKALEAIAGVQEAKPSHEAGTAVVILSEEVADETLKKVVEEQGYRVIG